MASSPPPKGARDEPAASDSKLGCIEVTVCQVHSFAAEAGMQVLP